MINRFWLILSFTVIGCNAGAPTSDSMHKLDDIMCSLSPPPPWERCTIKIDQNGCPTYVDCQTLCGGLIGWTCPKDQICVDDPSDNCDPHNGGADCIGICEPAHVCEPPICQTLVCENGHLKDQYGCDTCACAPKECGGLIGATCPDGQVCVDNPTDSCDPRNGGADCIGMCVGPASLVSIEKLTTGAIEVDFAGTPTAIYDIEASEDLVSYEVIAQGQADLLGRFSYIEADPLKYPARFYRAVAGRF